ncbi:MAG: hypothetical protein Q7S88_00360, partial [Candidatus Daviesbacteria bacterium]|nr:hypothetical protein [Candidatus Daviesbacteria bacterium]
IYIGHYPLQRAVDFQYGYKQMALYISKHYPKYEKIVIDPRFGNREFYFSGVPHVYIPYYTYLDPRKLQMSTRTPYGAFFDKYEIRNVNWDYEIPQSNYLYIVPHDNNPGLNLTPKIKQVHEIKLPNQKVEFRLYSEDPTAI